jgi:predicted transcriptional regulator
MKDPELITVETQVPDNEATAKACARWRKANGVTAAATAKRMEYSQPYISSMEKGRVKWTQDLLSRFIQAVKDEVTDRQIN